MPFSFPNFLNFILISVLAFSIACSRNYKRHPGRKVHASPQGKSKKEVEAKDKTAESFKVAKKGSSPPQDSQSNKSDPANNDSLADSAAETPASNSPDSQAVANEGTPRTTSKPLQFKINQAEISIAKAALDKEFLLQGALIPQDKVALGRSIKSRVVAFQQKGKTIVMLEATQGHSLNNDFSQKLVLATFPILKQDSDYITFDFNAGMSKLVSLRDWYAKDFDGAQYSSENQFAAFQVSNSYIESAVINEANQLVIRQVSLMTSNANSTELGAIRVPVEARYYLSPYRPSKSYEPVESPARFDDVGYFEINPQLSETGATLNYASRFHPSKPIIFAISSNTPAEYEEAVQQGILYWNKAFGKEIVKAVNAPEGVRAPDFNYNVVQWVNWDYAGSAYADGQMDPRTGEILHAQVFLTSAFAFSGKNKAREILRKLGQTTIPVSSLSLAPGVQGLEKEGWCNLEYKKTLVEALEQVTTGELSDAAIFKLSQDYVRTVVAHEIGHTLGLRHNFAGSLAATYHSQERPQIFAEYLKSGATNPAITYSSSVMDYHRIEEAAMIGDLAAKSPESFSYDLRAIQKLYFNKVPSQSKKPLFCTDSHADLNGFVDCKRFDFGASPIEFAKWETDNALQSLPQTLVEKYIRNKTDTLLSAPLKTPQVPLETTASLAVSILQTQNDLLKLLTVDRSLLQVERQFAQVDERTEADVKDAYSNYIETEVTRLGGIEALLKLIPENYAVTAIEKLNLLLANPHFRSGEGFGGKTYEFSDSEIQQIQKDLTTYLQKLEKNLILTDLKNLKTTSFSRDPNVKSSKFVNNNLSEEFAAAIQKKVTEYVITTSGSFIESEITKVKGVASNTEPADVKLESTKPKEYERVAVKLPTFKYSMELRILAAGIFGTDRGEDIMWGVEEKADLKRALKKILDEALTTSFDTMEANQQNRMVQKWLLENKKVLNELN